MLKVKRNLDYKSSKKRVKQIEKQGYAPFTAHQTIKAVSSLRVSGLNFLATNTK
jgi:hypothetical protein